MTDYLPVTRAVSKFGVVNRLGNVSGGNFHSEELAKRLCCQSNSYSSAASFDVEEEQSMII